jgi:hypothetical protein
VKALVLAPVPFGVVTVQTPSHAPAGTVVLISLSDSTVKDAFAWHRETAVAPVRCAPLIATVESTRPAAGANPLTTGGRAVTRNGVAVVLVPPPVVMLQVPSQAPAGTIASILVSDSIVKLAGIEQSETAVASVRLRPSRATVLPNGPLAGATEVISGGR